MSLFFGVRVLAQVYVILFIELIEACCVVLPTVQARIREAAAMQTVPGGGAGGAKREGEAERRMRELYEERLREYGDLAVVDDTKGDEDRYKRL